MYPKSPKMCGVSSLRIFFPGRRVGICARGFGTVVNGSVRIDILKFVGQDTSDGVGVAQFECRRPGLFDLHQDLGFLSLMTGTVGGLGRQKECHEQNRT